MDDKPKGKPRGRPFVPGDARINRGGQPREARELREALMAHGDEIIERFMELVRAGNAVATVKAMEWVVGRPDQHLTLVKKQRSLEELILASMAEDPKPPPEEMDGQAPAVTAWDPNSRPSA